MPYILATIDAVTDHLASAAETAAEVASEARAGAVGLSDMEARQYATVRLRALVASIEGLLDAIQHTTAPGGATYMVAAGRGSGEVPRR